MRVIADAFQELCRIEVWPTNISTITDMVGSWWMGGERPLAAIYPGTYLDAIHIKMWSEGRVENVAVFNLLAWAAKVAVTFWSIGLAMMGEWIISR